MPRPRSRAGIWAMTCHECYSSTRYHSGMPGGAANSPQRQSSGLGSLQHHAAAVKMCESRALVARFCCSSSSAKVLCLQKEGPQAKPLTCPPVPNGDINHVLRHRRLCCCSPEVGGTTSSVNASCTDECVRVGSKVSADGQE